MSTPISRDDKLQGLELYAPRRVRRQPVTDDQVPPPQTLPSAPERNQQHDLESDPWPADETSDVQTRIDDAIREAIQLAVEDAVQETEDAEQAFDDVATRAPAAPILDQPSISPRAYTQADTIDWPSPPELPRRRGSVAAAVPSRRLHLDPDVLPEPSVGIERRGVFPLLVRFTLVLGAAAIVAYGVTATSSVQRASETMAAIATAFREPASPPQVQPRLLVEDQKALENEPLPLGVAVDPPTDKELLLFAGLAAGTRLSAGAPVGKSTWRLRSHDLDGLYMYAPKDFVGVMNAAVDLLSTNQKLLDRRAVRLKWIAKNPVSSPLSDPVDFATPKAPMTRPLDPEQAAILMKQGQDSLKIGDISAARVAFGRLADAGSAEAALAIAATYDSRYLVKQNVIGVVGDETKARAWYQRASELGSAEAKNILARMATNGR